MARFAIHSGSAADIDLAASIGIGPWEAGAPLSPSALSGDPGLVSFSADGSIAHAPDTAAPPCWRIEFDDDIAAARAAIDGGEGKLRATETCLNQLPDAAARLQIDPQPEDPGPPTSVVAGCVAALESVGRLAFEPAAIETAWAGGVAARTAIGWGGDCELVVAYGLPREVAQLHARALAMTLRSRQAWARLLAIVLKGGARVAVASRSPVAMVTAVPAMWRLAKDALAQVQTIYEVQTAQARGH